MFSTPAPAQGEDAPAQAVAIFNEAQDLHEKGDLPGAIVLYQNALKILPEFAEAEYQTGIAQISLHNYEEAERSFRRAIALRPDWTLAMTSLTSVLLEKGELTEAETILQKVLKIEPDNPPALVALTDLSLQTDSEPELLASLLGKITVLTGKANPTASMWAARAALESTMGRPHEARASLLKSLAITPHHRNALLQLADLAIAEGDLTRAQDIATLLERDKPSSKALKVLRAKLFAAEGDFDEALKQIEAIGPTPGKTAATLRTRINTARTANPDELEKQLESGVKDPSIPGRLCSLYRKEDPAKALNYCRLASEAEPGNINHAIGFGAALVQAKQFEAAVRVLEKIIKAAPDNFTARANLATALFQMKRYVEAKNEFRWLTNARPRSATAYFFLGITHDHLAEYGDAIANYQQYLQLADPVKDDLDIGRVNLRMPALQKLLQSTKRKKSGSGQ